MGKTGKGIHFYFSKFRNYFPMTLGKTYCYFCKSYVLLSLFSIYSEKNRVALCSPNAKENITKQLLKKMKLYGNLFRKI